MKLVTDKVARPAKAGFDTTGHTETHRQANACTQTHRQTTINKSFIISVLIYTNKTWVKFSYVYEYSMIYKLFTKTKCNAENAPE